MGSKVPPLIPPLGAALPPDHLAAFRILLYITPLNWWNSGVETPTAAKEI